MNNPHLYVKVGLRHGENSAKAESYDIVGGLVNAGNEREDFLPFRLKKTDPKYAAVFHCQLVVERYQRFDKDTTAADAAQPKPSKKFGK